MALCLDGSMAVMKRLLLIEDDNEIRGLLRTFLEESGYAVDEAADGMEGARQALSSSYDLILLDIML
ncbi:MAG: response regulator, partial [Lachnospiraceae bacterium]|nr:response regulator [Lachnospiraceae bacterium]